MMISHTILRTTLAASLVAIGLAGCGAMRPSTHVDIYEATLSASQEVPPGTGGGTGTAEVQLNRDNNQLSWKVTYSGLSGPATAAHIHGPAAAGANAGVVVPFNAAAVQPIVGQATITPTQFGDLAAGLWYVNIHTAAAPGGEIRGQLRRRQ